MMAQDSRALDALELLAQRHATLERVRAMHAAAAEAYLLAEDQRITRCGWCGEAAWDGACRGCRRANVPAQVVA